MTAKVQAVSHAFIDSVPWHHALLAGFSLCLCQLTSALYFITRIKARCANLPVAVGGSMFSGDSLYKLLRAFPEIDYAVNGEGERPLSRLVGGLRDAVDSRVQPPPAVVDRQMLDADHPLAYDQLKTLNTLPVPDFDDYFELLRSLGPGNSFFPTLPVEMSRGCWWQRPAVGTSVAGCAFCNLNRQWRGYRTKKPPQIVREVDWLTTRHRSLSVAFMDNLIPRTSSVAAFQSLAALDKDLHLFCEIRADTSRPLLDKMKRAGVAELQIGIEALSTRLLEKLNKGTTAIQNLEIMKNCEELGLTNASNLILNFPGSDQLDVDETLQNLQFAQPFHPVKCVRFWMGVGSPVWSDPRRFGLQAVIAHPNWARLFPERVCATMRFPIQSYRGDRMRQRKLWRPVRQKVKVWEKTYAALHRDSVFRPILGYRDGGEFLIIRQRRYGADTLTHRLRGASRDIYLFCRRNRSLSAVQSRFNNIGAAELSAFLVSMVAKRLMFEENGRYLSLAVRTAARR
jgi:ribosomal peptide maturation radical SAM protein 1